MRIGCRFAHNLNLGTRLNDFSADSLDFLRNGWVFAGPSALPFTPKKDNIADTASLLKTDEVDPIIIEKWPISGVKIPDYH